MVRPRNESRANPSGGRPYPQYFRASRLDYNNAFVAKFMAARAVKSLVRSARLHGHHPFAYLKDMLERREPIDLR
jgi:hypothetical protein